MPTERSPARTLLTDAPFRRFMAASTFTSLAFGTTRFTFVWAMGDLTDWEPALGLLGVSLGVPALLFSAPFGNLADRHDRRRVAGMSTLAVSLSCLVVGVLLATDSLNPVSLGVAAFLLSIPLAGVQPAMQAMVPNLAEREHLMNAVALQNLSMMGSMVVGAFVGGAAITIAGTEAAFLIMAAISVLAALQILSLPAVAGRIGNEEAAAAGEPDAVDLKEGLAHARRDPIVGTILLMGTCLGLGSSTAFLFLPELARDELDATAFAAGLLNASMSLGLIITAGFLASRVHLRRPIRLMAIVFATIAGPGLMAIGLSPVYTVALLTTFGWGMGGGIVMTLQRTTLQQRTPDRIMGRIMGLFTLAQFGTFPVGALVGFALAGPLGIRGVFVVSGLSMFVVITLLAIRILRHEQAEHAEAPAAVQ